MCNPNTLQSDLNSLQCERLNTSLCNVLHKRITEWSKHITASSKHITERSKYIIARFKQLTARSKHLSVQSNCCHLGAFCVHHTTMHRMTSFHAKPLTRVRACVFSGNLKPALLAEWPGSFTCYCGNMGRNGHWHKSPHSQSVWVLRSRHLLLKPCHLHTVL